jgi:hypothetical protein
MSGDHLYLASNEKHFEYWSLKIVDISEPSEAKPVGWDLFPGAVTCIFSEGQHLFVAASGIQVLDVSDPLLPVEVAYLERPQGTTDIQILKDYAYACGGFRGGLYIIDVSDPARPSVLGISPDSEKVRALLVFAEGDRAYVTESITDDIHILDLGVPEEPRFVGNYFHGQSVADGQARGSSIYLVDDEGLHVIDVGDAAAPHLTAAYRLSDATGILVGDRGYAYVAMGKNGIRVIKLNDPVRHVEVLGGGEMRFRLPSGLIRGSYDVLVTSPNGDTARLENALEIY